jgi:iron complex transport system ATP-binding protein
MANCCDYFPCHENPCIGFSCQYCYCPLYKKECEIYGGTPKYIIDKTDSIKDCSDCMLPHKPKFKKILNKIEY